MTRNAPTTARVCYVANGHVYAAFKKSGDLANAQLFEGRAKKAFDLAYFYGNMLHFDRQRIGDDLDATSNAELQRLVSESGYLTTVAKMCKTWD